MLKEINKIFVILLIASIFLTSVTPIGILTISAENIVSVLKELYTGNGRSDWENRYKVTKIGGVNNISSFDTIYDATGLGGDSQTIHGTINVGTLYQNGTNYGGYSWGGLISYIYDEEVASNHLSIINLNPVIDTAYVTLDIMISPDALGHI